MTERKQASQASGDQTKPNPKPSRAFIIGDRDNGLTIVVTDPVMVVHYSRADLQDPRISRMSAADPLVSMAAVVQDVLPLLRGVEVVEMRDTANDMANAAHGDYTLDEEKALFGEVDYARTIGQIIRNAGSVYDVDFCVALDVDPCEIVARGRNTSPAMDIADYLKTATTTPEKFKISMLEKDNLQPLARWENPRKP
jgi:hypothetical protein